MTKSKDRKKMAKSNTGSTSADTSKCLEGSLEETACYLPSGLKPKLDRIFAEVEEKLPNIDFDLSDVDSDDEDVTPLTFSRPLKLLEEDKDLDTSQGSESLLSQFSLLNQSNNDNNTAPVDNIYSDQENSLMQFYDNDLAYELQQSGCNYTPPTVSSWADIPVPAEKDKNKAAKQTVCMTDIQVDMIENDASNDSSTGVPHKSKSVSWDENVVDNSKEPSDNRLINASDSCDQLSLNSLDDKGIRKQIDREENRNKDRALATRLISPQAPVLSTQILDNIDLDSLLQNLQPDQDDPSIVQREANISLVRTTPPDTTQGSGEGSNIAPTTDADNRSQGLTLIEKLAMMSIDQYGADLSDINPNTGAKKKADNRDEPNRYRPDIKQQNLNNSKMEAEGTDEIKPVETKPASPKKVTSSCGTSTANTDAPLRIITPRVAPSVPPPPPLPQPASKLTDSLKGDKEATVFIDLRNFDKIRQEQQQSIERVQKVLGIQNQPTVTTVDSTDSEEDADDWKFQRQQFKHGASPATSKPPSRKSSAKSANKPPVHPAPPRVINMLDQDNRSNNQGQERSSNNNTTTSRSAQSPPQRPPQNDERLKQLELIRKQREKLESERQAKLRLEKRLHALRPMASVGGRHDPAEETPTVFDLDASYEPPPRNLPPVLEPDTDCVLLTIHLSSNGEIVLHRGSGNKSVDTGTGLSASYTSLLTWLLSLVPSKFSFLQNLQNTSPDSQNSPWMLPFYVLGLQQVLLDGQLCLMVAVTPVEQFDAKSVPNRTKKNKKQEKAVSAFQLHLQKYFSTNTLHTVCPWLQNMVSMEVAPTTHGQKPDYVYRPPLPNITTKPLSTFIHVSPDPQAVSKVLNTSVGFFWQTVDSDEARLDQELHDQDVNFDTRNTLSLIYKKIYKEPSAMMGILNRVLQLGLDVAGIRLVYPSPEQMKLSQADNTKEASSNLDLLNSVGAVLALCIRGTSARSLWLDAVGPSDPVLARRTDPNSLCALYGGLSRDECLLFCPRSEARVQTELARWFGGRVPPGNVIDVGTPYTKKDSLRSGSPKGRRGNKKVSFNDTPKDSNSSANSTALGDVDLAHHRPIATLTATSRSEILLVISPFIPPKCFGIVLASCQRRGFQPTGVKRMRLSSKKAASLGIPSGSINSFCPGSAETGSYDSSLAGLVDRDGHNMWAESTFPCTILQLLKENASHSAASLVEDCMVQLTLHGIMGTLQMREGFPKESAHMFHAARYSDGLLGSLGGDFSKCFDPEVQINPSYVIPQLYTNPELEQITVLIMLGHKILKSSGLFVGKLLGILPVSRQQQTIPFTEGLELLGMKWLPGLTMSQAKEVTPCEVGDKLWRDSLHTLANEPGLVLALRGVDAFAKLQSIVQPRPDASTAGTHFELETIHARNAEEAYTYIRLFFTERELFSDPLARPMLPFIPHYSTRHDMPIGSASSAKDEVTEHYEESIFEQMMAGARPFITCLLIKPRAFKKHFSKILKKVTQKEFKIVGWKLQVLTKEQAHRLLPTDETDKDIIDKHIVYMTSAPSLCLCVERENAVKKLLDLLGPEDPQQARRHCQFYWRGVFGADAIMNAIYCSRSYQEAIDDQKLFFPEGLCCEQTDILAQESIVCPAVDLDIDLKYGKQRELVHPAHAEGLNAEDSSHALLLQTTCIILTPVLMKKLGSHFGFVEIIDCLIHQGFEFVGSRMVWFTQEQAEHLLCAVDAGSFQQVPMLTSGSSIVLALERDNAVLAFDTIIRESFSKESSQGKSVTDSLLNKYGKLILRPTDIKKAENALRFFFKELLPGSNLQIKDTDV